MTADDETNWMALGRPGGHPSSDDPDPGDGGPTLSICVPTYHRPVLVQRAIRSIVECASYAASDVEIIVSDNSPDVSEEACRKSLEAWGGRSLYIGNRPNIGFNDNYNQCVARASGRYVLFVHDDDRMIAGAVPAILDALAARDERDKVLLFGVHVVDETGHILRRQEFSRDSWVGASDALYRLLSDNGFNGFPALVVSRDAYAVIGPFDARLGHASDLDMWVRLFARFGVRCVPKTISAYSVHAGSATTAMAYDSDAIAKIMDVFERTRSIGILPAETIHRCQAKFLHQYILAAAYLELRSGDVAGARKVMALFDLPAVRSVGPSLAWLPVRLAFAALVRFPPRLVRPLMRLVDRLSLVRWVRSAQSRHWPLRPP